MLSTVWAMPLDPSVCSSVCFPRRSLLSFDSSYKHFKKVTTNYNNKLIYNTLEHGTYKSKTSILL